MSTSSSKHNLAARMAAWSGRHRKKAFWGWLAFVVVVFMAGNAIGTTNISDVDQFSGESHRAEVALDRSGLRPVKEFVFIQSDKLTLKDPAFQAAVGDVTDRLAKAPYVENVKSPLTGDSAVSGDGHAALVDFEIAGDSTLAGDRVDATIAAVAAAQAAHPALDIEQLGDASANKAINEVIGEDLAKAGELSLPLTLIILTLTFGTLVAAGVPLLIGITAVLAALGMVALPSEFLPVDANLPAVVLLIGLAVGVDYSLFYLRREREERAAGRSERSALETAAATSGRAVLISGVTVIVAMAGMFISGDKSFISFAEGAIVVVAIAVFASLTVLPAMLSWLGDRVEKGRIPLLGRRRKPAGQSHFWAALTGRVMRRPGLSILLAGGFLVALAIPALQMKIVTSGVEQLPNDIPIIVTYDKVRAVFPTEGVVATVVVEADDVRSGATAAGITALRSAVDSSDAFKPGTEVIYSKDGTVAQINVPTPGSGNDAASVHAVNVLRDEIIPATVGQVPGTSVNVTGDAASSEDFASQLTSRLPLIFAFVFGLAFLLMLVTFRSIVIPIKAIILNLLSVGAAYGVLVLVFQNGTRRVAARVHLDRRRGQLAAAVPVRGPVRALDGLPRLHPVPGPRALRPRHEHRRGRQAGHLEHRRHRDQRRRRDGRRLRGLHHPDVPRLQGDGLRARSGRPDRRDDRPRHPAARVDEAARRLELVPALMAGVAAEAAGGRSGPRAAATGGARPAVHGRRRAARAVPGPGRPSRSDVQGKLT